jgi:hypothetical protein
MGSNLNQIAKKLNQGFVEWEDLKDINLALDKNLELLGKVRNGLIGVSDESQD